MNIMLLAFVASIVNGSLCALVSKRKNRNPYAWFSVGFLFGLPGLVVALLMPRRKPKQTFTIPASVKPLKTAALPPQKFWYYLDPSHDQHGPMSFNALRNEWKEGKLKPSTYVWNEEMENWKHLTDLKEFNHLEPSTPRTT